MCDRGSKFRVEKRRRIDESGIYIYMNIGRITHRASSSAAQAKKEKNKKSERSWAGELLPGNVFLCVCVCLSIFAPRSLGSPEDVGQLYHHQSSAARSVAYKLTGRTSWSPYSLSRQRTSWITLAPSPPNLSLSLFPKKKRSGRTKTSSSSFHKSPEARGCRINNSYNTTTLGHRL